jgi:hypothetical protein
MSFSAITLHWRGQGLVRGHGVEGVALDAKDVADFHGVVSEGALGATGVFAANIAHNARLHIPTTLETLETPCPVIPTPALTPWRCTQAPPRPRHRRARRAHPPDHLVRFRVQRPRAALFNLERAGHVYSRISNPTNAVLEQRVAALEGGMGAIATASGQAALHLAIATLMGAGSHIVASTALYGGSQNLLHYTLRRFGIDTTFVKPGDIDGWRAAVRPNTKLFFGETVGNPGLDVLDIPTVFAIAHEAGVPLLVDSTLTSPWLIKPFEHGADLVYHSATKFLSGHGTVMGGIVVDGGSFDWDGPKSAGKFAELTQPYDGFHNMVFTEESTVGAFLLRARREGLRDFGACMSPHTAWLILQGIETLPLRMERTCATPRRWWSFWPATLCVARGPPDAGIAPQPCAGAKAAATRRGLGVQL